MVRVVNKTLAALALHFLAAEISQAKKFSGIGKTMLRPQSKLRNLSAHVGSSREKSGC
jgi:hypothetical protein